MAGQAPPPPLRALGGPTLGTKGQTFQDLPHTQPTTQAPKPQPKAHQHRTLAVAKTVRTHAAHLLGGGPGCQPFPGCTQVWRVAPGALSP